MPILEEEEGIWRWEESDAQGGPGRRGEVCPCVGDPVMLLLLLLSSSSHLHDNKVFFRLTFEGYSTWEKVTNYHTC